MAGPFQRLVDGGNESLAGMFHPTKDRRMAGNYGRADFLGIGLLSCEAQSGRHQACGHGSRKKYLVHGFLPVISTIAVFTFLNQCADATAHIDDDFREHVFNVAVIALAAGKPCGASGPGHHCHADADGEHVGPNGILAGKLRLDQAQCIDEFVRDGVVVFFGKLPVALVGRVGHRYEYARKAAAVRCQ